MDVELREIADFLAQHAPFDTLPREALTALPRRCTIRYARRGTVVLDLGEQGDGLYVVRSGAVDVVDDLGGLIERVGTGSAFGMSSLLEQRPTRHRCTATEDTLLLVLPADDFRALVREHPTVLSFFAGAHHDRLARAIAHLQQASSGTTVLTTPVGDLVTRPPVRTEPTATIALAAEAMAQAGVSSLLITDKAGVRGIVTDRDLRNRVLAVGLDPGRPIQEVMSAPPRTIRRDAPAFEALLQMVGQGIHHLPVVDERGAPVGVVTTTDLVRLENSNPVYLAADLARQTTVEGLIALVSRIPLLVGDLMDHDVSAADVEQITTALGDATRRRVLALAEAEMGPAPVPYAWVVLGSVAREEESLSSDQDHALIVAEAGHDAWFARLADRVVDVLERCGWPRCPGEVMATNPRWRLTVEGWREQFSAWAHEPTPDAVLGAAVFYDLRHLAGDPALTERVRRAAGAGVSERLVGHLSGQALRMRPPLGFFRGFVLEKEGAHGDTLDIKRGIAAVVQLARVYALRAGSPALSTRARLTVAAEAGLIDAGTATDLRDALELMSFWRLRHQVEQARAGQEPDDHLAPADLTGHQRRHLKDAFGIVREAQQQMGQLLPAGYA